jgi:4-hydroxy-tetrahydrodipicolinate reductase
MVIKIAIAGINGRMGSEIVAAAKNDPDFYVAAGLARGERVDKLPPIDVLIDFTTAHATVGLAKESAALGIPFVSGVTGLSTCHSDELRAMGKVIPLFYSRNFSVGISALLQLLPSLAQALDGYDVEVVEAHHRHKIDAPSGTAIALAEAITSGINSSTVHGREGAAPRQSGEIGMHSIRGGGNTGEHAILFMSDGEEIRIGHRALSRGAFALGALRAAKYVVGRDPGFYGMMDLLQS